MKAALKDARVPVPPEEAQAWRRCLHILAPLRTTHERKCMSTNIEKIINGTDNTLLAFHVADLGALFFPDDSVRGQALGRQMQAAVITGELASIVPDKQHVFISDLAAWPACPPIPASFPLRYWLPFMPTTGLVESVSSSDETLRSPEAPVERRARLLQWIDEESQLRGTRGALERVTAREKVLRPTADRSNIGKDISKAKNERAEARRAGPFDVLVSNSITPTRKVPRTA